MISRLLYLGATHKTTALAVREQLAAGPDRIAHLLDRLKAVAEEGLVLSTCGRFELYLLQEPSRRQDWPEYFNDAVGLSTSLCRHFETLTGEAAARRALRVAAGLESRIIGERQVLGQVRQAFEQARMAHATGPLLSALFRSAIHTGKRVRCETSINRAARSFAESAVDLLRQTLQSFTDRTLVVFGTGAMARHAASLLAKEPHRKLIVVSGHIDRAVALATEVGGFARTLSSLPDVLAEADAMICCASSRWGVVELSMTRRPVTKPLVIVDLGMPRNVDPSVGRLPGIRLIDLDRVPGAAAPGHDAMVHAERIVEQELGRLLKWIRQREVAPLVARLAKPDAGRTQRRELHRAIVQLKEDAA